VSGHVLNMASQQFSAAHFDCLWMECARTADQAKAVASNASVIRNGRMRVSTLPGLGVDLNKGYLKSVLAPGEPWWG
jgi:L-alanine-DL-glutamate epimerase-like enolase superfamily enzyme